MKIIFFSFLKIYSRAKPKPVHFGTFFVREYFLRIKRHFCEKTWFSGLLMSTNPILEENHPEIKLIFTNEKLVRGNNVFGIER